MTKHQQLGRLALRVEGDYWNAYYALPGTMVGAALLGTIRMRFVQDEPRKDAWMAMMKEAVSDIIEETCGERPVWPFEPTAAPEHEKSKES